MKSRSKVIRPFVPAYHNHLVSGIRVRRWKLWLVRRINKRMRDSGSKWELRVMYRTKRTRFALYLRVRRCAENAWRSERERLERMHECGRHEVMHQLSQLNKD